MCLVAAMAVSFGTMDWISGGVIAALVILNVSVGGYTEWQAEKVSLGAYKVYPVSPEKYAYFSRPLLLLKLSVLLKLPSFDDPAKELVPQRRLFLSTRSFQETSFCSRMETLFLPMVELLKDTAVISNVMKLS